MNRLALPRFALRSDERALAGVCAGIAHALGVDATLVRLVFAILALAGGAGIFLYLTLWAYAKVERRWAAALLALVSGLLVLSAVGFSEARVAGSRWSPPGSRWPCGAAAAFARTLPCPTPASRSRRSGRR